MNSRVRLAGLLLGMGYGTLCMAQAHDALHITRVAFNPTSGIVTVSGHLHCQGEQHKGLYDIIATVEQAPAQAGARTPKEIFGTAGIGSTVTDRCREGQAQDWSVSMRPISDGTFTPGSKAHFVVSSSPHGNDEVEARVISTEADLPL